MRPNDATLAQIAAANPGSSTWLSANAGSGKTRVLTDRVARLLLNGVPPERVLCLTYTKAAASEMQNRLFKRLGEWAMKDDDPLADALAELGVDPAAITSDLLSRARTLFARAIETPGGLKIQTIHSFCAAVLRRFPLEAGVSPGFSEMDERAQKMLCADVLDRLADGPGQGAVDGIATYLSSDDSIHNFLSAVLSRRENFEPPVPPANIFGWFGLPPGLTAQDILDEVFLGGEEALCRTVLDHLDPDNRNDRANIRRLDGLHWDAFGLGDLAELEGAMLTGSDTKKSPDTAKIGTFPNKDAQAALGADLPAFNDLMQRVEAARPRRRALLAAEKTVALHEFAAAFLPAYHDAKAARGWLDFDDLINRTRKLLSAPGLAQWVLFRLDGGIDHILVDEAQDTSPAQWEIVAQLSAEFAAGDSAREEIERTIFVVGDKKQSIYSFQGADPEGFDRMRDYFQAGLAEVEAPFQSCELTYSFRSAPPILALVDRVFAGASQDGVGQDVRHIAFKSALPGRVDLWPPVPEAPKAAPGDWESPVDLLPEEHHHVVLANRVADAVAAMLTDGTAIEVESRRRPVRAGDILILVQRRSDLFHEMIAAIKARDLPIAGADRMRLAAELAVKDLTALLAFLATPEDDLSLAAVLRSPLFGWSEQGLFDLAHGRGKRFLWRALQDREAEFQGAVEMLTDLRDHADFLRPYDLLERVLIRHDGRRNLLARMGNEAEDGIDAMLAQALAYERTDVPSLTGFVGWLQADDVTIKRDPGSAGNQIRVMSIHGAKGLESPVVILPDTAYRQKGSHGVTLLCADQGPLVWPLGRADAPDPLRPLHDAHSARETEERNRLLYVAMTRAESWLILCAAGKLETKSDKGWFLRVRDAAEEMGAAPHAFFGEMGLRLETGDWSTPGETVPTGDEVKATLPVWAGSHAPETTRPQPPLSPSDLGGAKVIPGDTDGLDEEAAKRRGRLIHLLLEHLPNLPQPAWRAAGSGILAIEGEVAEAEADALLEEAARTLTTPDLVPLFAPEALAEVSLTGFSPTLGRQLIGQIDRLIVTPGRVLAVDFKTNAGVPAALDTVPEGLLRQMGAYSQMLAALFPDHQIETAILWTRTAQLMHLPHADVMAALQRAADA